MAKGHACKSIKTNVVAPSFPCLFLYRFSHRPFLGNLICVAPADGQGGVDSAISFILLYFFSFSSFFLSADRNSTLKCVILWAAQPLFARFPAFFPRFSHYFLGLKNVKFLLFVFFFFGVRFYCQRAAAAHLQPSIWHAPFGSHSASSELNPCLATVSLGAL